MVPSEENMRWWSVVLGVACTGEENKGARSIQNDIDGDGWSVGEDCDDADPQRGGPEVIYDGIDNDCDPSTLDDDMDGDGLLVQEDCDDTDPNKLDYEIFYDGIDNDCDPSTVDDDIDGDGFVIAEDCNDGDPNYGGSEVPYDDIDNDCDPATRDDDVDADGFLLADDCNDNDPNYGGPEEIYDGFDNDCDPATLDDDLDGDTFPITEDCQDLDPAINPNAIEICGDYRDNDCSGFIDDGVDDLDSDGYIDALCTVGGLDCDDGDGGINPGATEVPSDGIDNDCDPLSCDDPLLVGELFFDKATLVEETAVISKHLEEVFFIQVAGFA